MRIFLALLLGGIALAVGVSWLNTRSVPAPVAPAAVAPKTAPAAPATVTGPEPVTPAPLIEPVEEGDDGPLEFEIRSQSDLILAMRELGVEDLEERMAQWALSRGYPEYDTSGNLLLDQPYAQYDNETLRGLADNEDMWAQQILAQRLMKDSPAEAADWFRRAAANGSVYAMTELARLYMKMASGKPDTDLHGNPDALEQVYALSDSSTAAVSAYAWTAAAERAGWDPTRSGSLTNLIGRKLNDEQIAEACEHAGSLSEALAAERGSRGLNSLNGRPPPLVYQPEEFGGTTQCYDPDNSYDTTGCREVILHAGPSSFSVWVCDQ